MTVDVDDPQGESSAEAAGRVPEGNLALPQPPAVNPSEPSGGNTAGDVPVWSLVLLIAATFGAGMAMIVPMAYSLAVRLDQLAPGRTDALGLVLAVGSAATLVLAPLTGILSDRLRSRWGRRRPFTVLGLLIGGASVPVMAFAPDLTALTVGWSLSTIGWGTTAASLGNWQADRLPPRQRGRVSGLTGVTMQVAPVVGIILVGLFRDDVLVVFALPAVIGAVLVVVFLVVVPDRDSRGMVFERRLTLGGLVRSYGFNPRTAPDFAWNWLGRFIFFSGLTLTTSFPVFFVAQRLELRVPDVAEVLAIVSASSIVTAMLGSLGGGWLSDRVGRRKPFILAGAALFAAGCSVSAFAHDLPTLMVGTLLNSLGIATFSAVGQALLLDVLPDREREAGRYTAIALFAQKIPGVFAPVLGGAVLAIGAGAENFIALYLLAAALAFAGGLLITLSVRSVR
ncbi:MULTISPECIES: MFS transporter [unclassified Microbacterium]|uniref:MFS transporter n=1 Tax=unclassified Microbacterium TaxID=2609290 RepID=UPI000EA90A32|nr:MULTISPECIES: MFS transporter [unclassified Microbacterium]MBT2486550.1 MFS transporter [Microbacterium sp. ISL-108]RKN69238.1 MFS transporter [Microbacterium sp. CGR2]